MSLSHLISIRDVTREEAILILDTAEQMAATQRHGVKKLPTLQGKTVVNLFFEDSTRTRLSFEAAEKRLGAAVTNFSASGSSLSKGESLKDTALTLEAMGADAVAGPDSLHLKVAEAIMRSHFEMGLDISHPEVLIGCAQDIGMPGQLAALAIEDEEWASRVYSDYQMAMHMGVTSVPTYVLDAQFLVDGHQTVTAFSNILATAWDNARKDRA